MFPMWKIEMEDTYRYRDVDSDIWVGAEPHELLRTGFKSVLYVKENVNEDWIKLPGLPQDLAHAHVRFEHIKQNYSYWKSCFLNPNVVMFSVDGRMFKLNYVHWNQFSVSGHLVGYPETDDFWTKRNFSLENVYVFTYVKDEMVLMSGEVYLNGEKILTREDLIKIEQDHGIATYKWENFWDKDLLNYIQKNYPQAKTYNGHLCSGGFPWTRKQEQGVEVKPI